MKNIIVWIELYYWKKMKMSRINKVTLEVRIIRFKELSRVWQLEQSACQISPRNTAVWLWCSGDGGRRIFHSRSQCKDFNGLHSHCEVDHRPFRERKYLVTMQAFYKQSPATRCYCCFEKRFRHLLLAGKEIFRRLRHPVTVWAVWNFLRLGSILIWTYQLRSLTH